jgi:amino acid transporter
MRRALGRFDVTCLGLNAIVGSGIFLLPDDLFRELGVLSPLAFVCCAVGLMPVALCYAEAARTCERTGGPYVYAREAFGPSVGFGVGWMCFVNSVFSFAAVAAGAAAYAGGLVPALSGVGTGKVISAVVIALFAALNYRGAKPGAVAVDLFTAGKFLVLLLLVSTLLPQVSASHFAGASTQSLAGLGQATFIALFAAQGFEVVPVPAGETKAPKKDIPFAVLSSLGAASLLYIIVQVALVGSGANLTTSDKPLADAAQHIVPALGVVITAGGLVSMLGFVSGSALGTPRYLYAVALEGQLPRALAATHPRFQSPHIAVTATAALAVACVLPFDYRALIGMSNVAVAVQYLVTCLAILKRRNAAARTESTPALARVGSLALPVAGAAVSLWIFTEASSQELVWAAVSLVVGAVLVRLTTLVVKRATPAETSSEG